MGSYGPAVIASDAHRHRVEICGVKCSTEEDEADDTARLGYRYVKGRGESPRRQWLQEESEQGECRSLWDSWRRSRCRGARSLRDNARN